MRFRYLSSLRRRPALIPCVAVLLAARLVQADVLVIGGSGGTIYDGILDGFPTLAVQDGTPDFGNNALAVALKAGVTEERAIVEFPLASLAGLTAGDIASAKLTFNIDDVVSSFGPGASFSGNAAAAIFLFGYAGNGTIDLADFNNVAGAPAGSVNTTPLGTITDATLAVSGPLVFDVDVTATLENLLTGAATHAGFVLVTNTDNTATSIDNLGFSGAGPAGVNGSAMPFLTITTVADEPPILGKEQHLCQQTLSLEGRKFAAYTHTQIQLCFNRVLKDVGAGKDLAAASSACAKGLALAASPESKIDKVRAKALAKIADKCGSPLTPADIGSPCDAGAASFADTAVCVLNHHFAQAQEMVRAEYRDACAIVSAVARETEYPVLCQVP